MAGTRSAGWVLARAPATSANLGPGFDALGLALEWRAEVRCALAPEGLVVRADGPGAQDLPRDGSNLVARAARAVLAAAGRPAAGLRLHLANTLPVGRGLGSSAAAIAAGLTAANALLGDPLGMEELLRLGTAIEGHPDNLAPALLGGVCASAQGAGGAVFALPLPPPPGLAAMVAIPRRPLPTREARHVLPRTVAFADAVANVQRASLLVAALATGRLDALAAATADRLHQPYRARLLPGLEVCLRDALAAGALGAFLSGAGPSVLALVPAGRESPRVRDVLRRYATAQGGGEVRPLSLSATGTTVSDCPPPPPHDGEHLFS